MSPAQPVRLSAGFCLVCTTERHAQYLVQRDGAPRASQCSDGLATWSSLHALRAWQDQNPEFAAPAWQYRYVTLN